MIPIPHAPFTNDSVNLPLKVPEIIYRWSAQDARISRSKAGAFVRVRAGSSSNYLFIIKRMLYMIYFARKVTRERKTAWMMFDKQDGVNQEIKMKKSNGNRKKKELVFLIFILFWWIVGN